MLNKNKHIEVGNATGIIVLPYRSGVLKRYPINKIKDPRNTNNVRLPPIYLIILVFFCLLDKRPVQIKINNNAVIGDMRPIGTFPKEFGFFIKVFSISQGKLKK